MRNPLRLIAALCGLTVVPLSGYSADKASAAAGPCRNAASNACYQTFTPEDARSSLRGALHYYASWSKREAATAQPTRALVAMHGFPRDANKTFNAALLAAQKAGAMADTLVLAPVFQVPDSQDKSCRTPGVPAARRNDLVWTCSAWPGGGVATNDPGITSFAALDALLKHLKQRWPSLQTITVAGFSAGAQFVQHYVGFATPPDGVALRFVVSDPGSWLYFDPQRPVPQQNGVATDWSNCDNPSTPSPGACSFVMTTPAAGCPGVNDWKYGMDKLPAALAARGAQARSQYARSEVHYLEGSLDSSNAPGTFYGILDKSCAASAQGPFRLQRGLAYAAYDRAMLSQNPQRTVTIVPGCAHDVACVFPNEAARSALFGARP